MKKLFLLLLLLNSQLLAQGWAPKYPNSGTLKLANDSWWTHDKLTHALAGDFISREFTSMTKNKYTGALAGFGLLLLWEVKDGYFNYQDFGAFGGDNFSYKDLSANALGCLHSLAENICTKVRPWITSNKLGNWCWHSGRHQYVV